MKKLATVLFAITLLLTASAQAESFTKLFSVELFDIGTPAGNVTREDIELFGMLGDNIKLYNVSAGGMTSGLFLEIGGETYTFVVLPWSEGDFEGGYVFDITYTALTFPPLTPPLFEIHIPEISGIYPFDLGGELLDFFVYSNGDLTSGLMATYGAAVYSVSITPHETPIPPPVLLLGSGLFGLGWLRRKCQKTGV